MTATTKRPLLGAARTNAYLSLGCPLYKTAYPIVMDGNSLEDSSMKTRKPLLLSFYAPALLAAASLTSAQRADNDSVVAAITKIENDTFTADLANDTKFFERTLADDWSFGDSDGAWHTKAQVLKDFADPANKTLSEKMSALKVSVYGDTAIATYTDVFDEMLNGVHRLRTVLTTDTFVKTGSEWKEVASHSSPAKYPRAST